ncbi:MAG: hypothetical protein S4CHLAM6_03290 [Chlamydiae bacterium]|nr:hypothetical protein [Chlamydiota bacterium]
MLEVIDESQSYSLQVDRKSKGKITVQLQTPLNSNLKLKVELESLKGARNHGIVDISDGRVHELVTNIKEGQYLDCYIKYYFSGSFDAEVFPPTSYGINYLYKSKEL